MIYSALCNIVTRTQTFSVMSLRSRADEASFLRRARSTLRSFTWSCRSSEVTHREEFNPGFASHASLSSNSDPNMVNFMSCDRRLSNVDPVSEDLTCSAAPCGNVSLSRSLITDCERTLPEFVTSCSKSDAHIEIGPRLSSRGIKPPSGVSAVMSCPPSDDSLAFTALWTSPLDPVLPPGEFSSDLRRTSTRGLNRTDLALVRSLDPVNGFSGVTQRLGSAPHSISMGGRTEVGTGFSVTGKASLLSLRSPPCVPGGLVHWPMSVNCGSAQSIVNVRGGWNVCVKSTLLGQGAWAMAMLMMSLQW